MNNTEISVAISSYDEGLNTVLFITREMLRLATLDEWEKVVSLEKERFLLLNEMGGVNRATITSISDVEGNLKELIMLNTRLSNMGEIKKSECFSQVSSGRKKIKAFNEYTSYKY